MLMHSCAIGDPKGPKVGHDFTEMGEGEARILKNGRIIDNEGLFRFFRLAEPLAPI